MSLPNMISINIVKLFLFQAVSCTVDVFGNIEGKNSGTYRIEPEAAE